VTPPSGTPFDDPQDYIALPPDRRARPVRRRFPAGHHRGRGRTRAHRLRPALWQLDPAGQRPAHRLTRGAAGESAPVFTPAGDLLFASARPDPDRKDQPDDAPAALWSLPATGGEARIVGTRPGGVSAAVVARDAGTVAVSSMTMPGAAPRPTTRRRGPERKERKVSAILHSGPPGPVLGPRPGPGRAPAAGRAPGPPPTRRSTGAT
jgi:hypothetical protein